MNAFERAHEVENKVMKIGDRTLVIIDVQPTYVTESDSDLVEAIFELVCHAKKHAWPIIIVEFDGCGNTLQEILDEVGDHKHQTTIIKRRCSGGDKIVDFLNQNPKWPLDLVVCGVYGDRCVSQTVAELYDYSNLVEVEVVSDAISPPYMSQSEPDEYGQQKEREVTIGELVGG